MLSLLVFCKDDVQNAISLIKDMYDFVDEIVLMDSSKKSNSKTVISAKKQLKLNKVRIFYVPALGYPDPLRMYALKQCKGNWVLLLDTDERLSKEFKTELKNIVKTRTYNAFAIKRFEDFEEGKNNTFFTWQIRLFRRDNVLFKGILHEQAIISGKLRRLESKYFMMHVQKLMHHEKNDYYKIKQVSNRLSYELFNENLLEYISRFFMPEKRNMHERVSGKAISKLLTFYETLKRKKPEDELSLFDYFLYHTMFEIVFNIKKRDFLGFAKILPEQLKQVRKIRSWKEEPDAKEIFELSKIVNKVGVTRYLDLDKKTVIETINHKYPKNKQGIDLLFKLLLEKYRTASKQ